MTVMDGVHFGTGLLVVYLTYKFAKGVACSICRYTKADVKLSTFIKHASREPKNTKPVSRNTISFKY